MKAKNSQSPSRGRTERSGRRGRPRSRRPRSGETGGGPARKQSRRSTAASGAGPQAANAAGSFRCEGSKEPIANPRMNSSPNIEGGPSTRPGGSRRNSAAMSRESVLGRRRIPLRSATRVGSCALLLEPRRLRIMSLVSLAAVHAPLSLHCMLAVHVLFVSVKMHVLYSLGECFISTPLPLHRRIMYDRTSQN